MTKIKDFPAKATSPVAADSFLGADSEDSSKTKRFSFSSMISALALAFSSVFAASEHNHAGVYSPVAHTHAHNDTTSLNSGNYQHLTAEQLAALPTDSAAAIARAVRWSKKYISGN